MKGITKATQEIDVVVIGSGAAGMAAALTAAEGGAKVIIFEKLRHHGGLLILLRDCLPWKATCSGRGISALPVMKHSRPP